MEGAQQRFASSSLPSLLETSISPGQLSISKDEVLDVSFHDFKSQGMDWIFGVKVIEGYEHDERSSVLFADRKS